MGCTKIANVISRTHNDTRELQNISPMSIQRYKDAKSMDKIKELDAKGVNVTEVLLQQHLDSTTEILEELKYLSKESKQLYEDAKTDGSILDRTRVMKEIRDNLLGKVRVLESRVQHCARQIKQAKDNDDKKIQNLTINLIKISDNFCDSCKQKMLDNISVLSKEVIDVHK